MLQKDILSKLNVFGLNNYEAKLWGALLSRGVASAGELSDISNVPRSRTYDVLESLEKKGFILLKLGKPIKYIAVPPIDVLENIKKNVHSTAEQQTKQIEDLKSGDVIENLTSLYTNGVATVDHQDLTGAIKGRNNIHNTLSNTIKNAKHSVTILTTQSGLTRKLSTLKSALCQAKKNGASIRIVAPLAKESQHLVKDLQTIVQLRNIKNIPGRFCIVDEKETMLMPLSDSETSQEYDFAIWLSSPFLGGALTKLFDNTWKQSSEETIT